MAAISWCGCKMADKRITDLPEAVTITVDKLVVLDSADVGSCSTPSIFLDLAVDDILSIEVEADLNNNLTVIDGGLVANRIG